MDESFDILENYVHRVLRLDDELVSNIHSEQPSETTESPYREILENIENTPSESGKRELEFAM